MKPGIVLRGSSDEQNLEMQMERQMGCMAGFLQIFDRHQALVGRRGIYSARRLPSSPSPAPSCASPSERSDSSFSSSSKEIPSPTPQQPQAASEVRPPSPEPVEGWADAPPRPSLPLPVFGCKEGARSSWKFREAPRLSLDSRVDGRGKLYPRAIRTSPVGQQDDSDASGNANQDKQRRSPSVVARLMGLDALPGSSGIGGAGANEAEPYKRAELRRSASESRASRDLHYQFVDAGGYFPVPSSQGSVVSGDKLREVRQCIVRDTKPEPRPSRLSHPLCGSPQPPTTFCTLQRKSFFDVQDYFVSELPKRHGAGSMYGEIEKRLRMRGIDEPAKDLETLKQILEAIQLKGLLHSRRQLQRTGRAEAHHEPNSRNFVYEHSPTRANRYDSSIVVIKPASRSPSRRSPPPPSYSRPNASPSPPSPRRHQVPPSETASRFPRRNRGETGRNPSRAINEIRAPGAGTADPIKARSSASLARRQSAPGSQPAGPRGRLSTDRGTSLAHSPKAGGPRKAGSDPETRSLRSNNRTTAMIQARERIPHRMEEDDSTGSDGSLSASSQFDFERVKSEYRDGRILLERCDKLLHSIAEITSKTAADEEEQVNAVEQQPSPVSVLDAGVSFDRDDAGAPPSPLLTKRCIDFKEQSEVVSAEAAPISSAELMRDDGSEIDDGDFSFVLEILRASDPHQTAENRFWSLGKRRQETGGAAGPGGKDLPLHQRLVFDAVLEIVERQSQVSPWEAFLWSRSPVADGRKGRPLPGEVWAELRTIQEHAPGDDLCEVICGVLRKDMAASAAVRAWSDRPAEMSDAVLDIERLIFKDLVAETILHLSAASERRRSLVPHSAAGAPLPRRRLLF